MWSRGNTTCTRLVYCMAHMQWGDMRPLMCVQQWADPQAKHKAISSWIRQPEELPVWRHVMIGSRHICVWCGCV